MAVRLLGLGVPDREAYLKAHCCSPGGVQLPVRDRASVKIGGMF